MKTWRCSFSIWPIFLSEVFCDILNMTYTRATKSVTLTVKSQFHNLIIWQTLYICTFLNIITSNITSIIPHSSLLISWTSPFLSCQDDVMQYWMQHGAPAVKLLLGISTHAFSFTLSTTATGLGAPVSSPANPGPYTQQIGLWSYYEVKRRHGVSTVVVGLAFININTTYIMFIFWHFAISPYN